MRIKIIDIDILQVGRIDGLAGYDAVEILFRNGRDPIGRARITCNGDSLDVEKIRNLIDNLPQNPPLKQPEGPLPTVTVVVCTRNRHSTLPIALRSLACQKYPADEIIVVDNGCQEETRSLVEDILPNARYLQERYPGLDFARNRALVEASGEIIAFLDDDAEADPYWVRSIAECFAVFPRAGAITGLVLPFELDSPGQKLFESNGGFARGFSRRVLPHDGARRLGMRLPPVANSIGVGCGCNMAFKTKVLQKLQGFDEALDTGPPLPGGGDLDIFYRVTRAGHELVYEPRAIVRHCHRRSATEVRKQLSGHHKSLSAFLIKTIQAEHGKARIWASVFLLWRLAKTGFRIIRRLAGRDVLPLSFLVSIVVASLTGLGSYQASRWRLRGKIRQHGGSIPGFFGQLSEFLRYRELMWNLTKRDLKVKYRRSLLGFLWTILNPLVTVGVLVLVFSYVVRINISHYWAFLISGYFVWNFFSQTLNGGVQASVDNAYLTRSAYFPQEVLIISAALARLIEFLAELAIVMVLLAIFHHKGLPLSFVMILPLVPILFFIVIGLSLPVVTMAIYFNDTIQAIPLAMIALFYASPVFYNVALVPENIRTVYLLNPIASLLTLFHSVLYRGEMPDMNTFLSLAAVALFLGLLSYKLFNRKKREFAEIV
jgi:ABC-type polysaccharide/polyol phosphate export permease/GT2 family glycosyltransferase